MFGHKSDPSIVYSYGALDPRDPLVDEQMKLAHRYGNTLVELELARRKRVDETLRRLSPELVECEATVAAECAALDAARTEIKKAFVVARKKVRPPELVETVKNTKARLAEARARRKALRTALFESPAWTAEQDAINKWRNAEQKRVRAECGLFWGTYLQVEQSMSGCSSGAPPKFHRWDGGGHLAVQLQGGLSPADAIGGADSRIRVTAPPATGSILQRKRAKILFRVGSDSKGGPVFTSVPFVMHRPLPEDASIKWVHLVRRRIGTTLRFSVQFVLSRVAGWVKLDRAATGVVGIDVGWRIRDDGSLRVAYWRGSDGREGELALGLSWLFEMRKTKAIQSSRDLLFDVARSALVAWLGSAGPLPVGHPLEEARKTLAQWKSQARLAALVTRWRDARFTSDSIALAAGNPLMAALAERDPKGFLNLKSDMGIFDLLTAWCRRDWHLYQYESHLRDHLQSQRLDLYRNFAALMRRSYAGAKIENLDLRDFHELPEAEETPENQIVRQHTRDACLSSLLGALKHSMPTTEVAAAYTTMTCPACGNVFDFDRMQLRRKCPKCGKEDDQDGAASDNIRTG